MIFHDDNQHWSCASDALEDQRALDEADAEDLEVEDDEENYDDDDAEEDEEDEDA